MTITIPEPEQQQEKKAHDSEEELKRLESLFDIPNNNQQCPAGNQIEILCTSDECRAGTSLICSDNDCSYCGGLHDDCGEMIKLKYLFRLLRQHRERRKKFIIGLYQKEEEMIRGMRASRDKQIMKFKDSCFAEDDQTIINGILSRGHFYVQSEQANKIIGELKKICYLDDEKQKHLIEQYRTSINERIIILNAKKDQLVSKISSISTVGENYKKVNNKFNNRDVNIIGVSKILTNAMCQFMFDALKYPSKISLLFRGSEHQFSAKQFHNHCDSAHKTITVIKTEFDKILGGFFEQRKQTDNYQQVASSSNQSVRESFLLQFNFKNKLDLIGSLSSIKTNETNGPCFGNGDIFISDRCHQNSHSYSKIPTSYNNNYNFLQNDQNNWSYFCGAPEGCNFKVKQYEVFSVEWPE